MVLWLRVCVCVCNGAAGGSGPRKLHYIINQVMMDGERSQASPSLIIHHHFQSSTSRRSTPHPSPSTVHPPRASTVTPGQYSTKILLFSLTGKLDNTPHHPTPLFTSSSIHLTLRTQHAFLTPLSTPPPTSQSCKLGAFGAIFECWIHFSETEGTETWEESYSFFSLK